MSKWALIAVMAGVWVTAVGSAAALAYDLNRPLRGADVTWHRMPRRAAQPKTSVSAATESLSESTLRVPTITIVGHSVESHSAPAPAAATDISEMSCSDWRELDIGSGHVRVCQ